MHYICLKLERAENVSILFSLVDVCCLNVCACVRSSHVSGYTISYVQCIVYDQVIIQIVQELQCRVHNTTVKSMI